jgi:ankyrin repeat protein
VGILVEGGADVNARGKDHETPLHIAYRNNRLDIVRFLLKSGADMGAKNNRGETPFQLAPRLTGTESDNCYQTTSPADL